MRKRILCFGDSNTWGFTPGLCVRMDENTRWTSLLQKRLGESYRVIECGLNGRTTTFDDDVICCTNGLSVLPYELITHKPLDLLVISLGTNDLKYTDARGSAKGLEKLICAALEADEKLSASTKIFSNGARILVISPIPYGEGITDGTHPEKVAEKYGESLRFAEFYEPLCEKYGISFFDASKVASPSMVDSVHMDQDSHRCLADALCDVIKHLI